MFSSTREPGGNGRVAVAEDPLGCGNVEPLRERRQHFANALRRGFETVHRGVTARTERDPTGLAAEGLDALICAMGAVTNEGMELRIRDAIVGTGGGRTGKAIRVNALRRSAAAFQLTPRADW